jgi:DNA-binding transcriptional LysR family regulator
MSQADPTWDHYRSFLAVLEDGSLSGAARTLGLTQPTLARHIEQLEAALGGVALFTRSPRGLSPTDAAAALEPHAQAMASAAAALVRAVSGAADAVEGAVRISASEVIGAEVLPAMLRDLRALHPKLSFELVLSNQSSDLLRRDADIAVRMTRPKQTALVAKKAGDVMLGLHARRDYLKRHGTPKSLDDVDGHSIIGYDRETIGVQAIRAMGLTLTRDMFAYRTDNDLAQLNAIRAGCGIGICQVALAKRDPELVRLLPRAFAFPLESWIVMHEDLRSSARMRVVFDHLAEAMTAYARA